MVNENLGRFILGEKIKIELCPPPNEPEKATQMVIGGLIPVQYHSSSFTAFCETDRNFPPRSRANSASRLRARET